MKNIAKMVNPSEMIELNPFILPKRMINTTNIPESSHKGLSR
jgi:hypothetical protein